jgi:hypothetical protein
MINFLAFLFIIFLSNPSLIFASDEPFVHPSNWGSTGLLEIPTARVIKEHSYRIGISQIKPYRYYYGAISPIKRLEIDARITEVLGVKIKDTKWQGYGNYKDKAFDFKYQIFTEGKYMPAIAIGIMDPHGTRIYPSQYVVVSKQIYPFDFTLGFGNGRFGNRALPSKGEGIGLEILSNPEEWLRDSQFFGGIQFAPSKKYVLMVEYSPIKYHKQIKDPAQQKYFLDPVPLNYNFGFRYRPTKWSEIDLSYQRGNEIGINLSMAFDIGKPLIPIYDPPYKELPSDRLYPTSDRITKALYFLGFSEISVIIIENELWMWVQNERYYYNTRAIWVILENLIDIIPEDIEKIYIILKENGIPIIEFTTTKADIIDLYAGRLTINEFIYLSWINTALPEAPEIKVRHKNLFRYGLKPSLETFLNDPSGFFTYRFGIMGWISYHPWRGSSFITEIATYPLNTISSVNEPLSIPVRTDIVFYKKEKVNLERLMFDQIKRLTPTLYARVSAGLLEVQYAGFDAEIAKPVFNGRILFGLSGSAVKKRHSDNPFKLKTNEVKDIYTTAFINTRINIPEKEFSIDLKAGRFLAGDNGIRFTISKFINGVIIWAWYSVTDTSVFKDNINRGYHDKGIGVSIPIRLFKGTDSRSVYSYTLSPWTRDTGQDIEHFNTLFDFIGRNTKVFIEKDMKINY